MKTTQKKFTIVGSCTSRNVNIIKQPLSLLIFLVIDTRGFCGAQVSIYYIAKIMYVLHVKFYITICQNCFSFAYLSYLWYFGITTITNAEYIAALALTEKYLLKSCILNYALVACPSLH